MMVGLFLMLRILLLTSRCLVESVCFPICNLSGAQHSESHFCHFGVTDFVSTLNQSVSRYAISDAQHSESHFCHFGVTDFVSTSALQWCSHLVSLIYIYIASQDYFPICNLSDTPNLGLSIHTLLIINTYSNYHHALTLCAQLPKHLAKPR
jgi:hypothetical protein